jgi:hypothetical protein
VKENDIALFLAINEPAFELDGKQYSVCSPSNELFSTWDSDGNTFDFHGITALLDNWIINGKPFREIVEKIM